MNRYTLLILVVVSNALLAARTVVIHQHVDGEEPRSAKVEEVRNLSDNYGFKEKTRVVLPNGEVRIKHQQYYKGVPIMDGYIVTKE